MLATGLRWGLLGLALLVLIVLPFLLFEKEIAAFVDRLLSGRSLVALGLIVVATLALDVMLPVPSSVVSVAAGASLGFIGGTFVAWLGMTIGCLLGYWIGATGGSAVIRRILGEAELERAANITGSVGMASLVVTRAVPVLAEAATLAAGAAGFPLPSFLAAVSLANLGIAAAYAAIGAFALDANSFLLAFAGAVAIPVIGWVAHQLWARRA